MNKLLMIVAAVCMLSITAANAQISQDSSKAPIRQGDPELKDRTLDQQTPEQDKTMEPSQNLNQNKDMVVVPANQVPDALKQTLSSDMYKGWESSTIYRSKNSDQYMVEIKDGTQTKTYRFDAQGKPIKDH